MNRNKNKIEIEKDNLTSISFWNKTDLASKEKTKEKKEKKKTEKKKNSQ